MIEFVLGGIVTLYICGLLFFIYDERPKRGNILLYIFWPLVIALSPLTRYMFRRWKYERRRVPIDEFHTKGYADYLRPNRSINDVWGWSETYNWFKRKIKGA